jgi:curved DNA-binding protein CbpA
MSTDKTHYQILGIDPHASEEQIRKAYKKLARVYHPDLNPKRPRSAHDRFRRLQKAYDVLSDPISRRQYDESLGIGQTPPETKEAGHTDGTRRFWTVDIDQEATSDRWLDRLNWHFISGLLLSILSASWLVYLVNSPVWQLRRVRARVEMALILFCVGIGLILFDIFSSKPRHTKLNAEKEFLREEILAMLPDAQESQRGLNDFVNQTIGKPGILSLELNELERVKEYLQNRINRYDQEPGFGPSAGFRPEYPRPQPRSSTGSYAPFHSAPGEYVRPEYKDEEWTVYPPSEKAKTGWFETLGWRRKLALGLWVVCLLGAFVPATYWVSVSRRWGVSASVAPSFRLRLLYATIPLIMIWIGTRMSDEDGLETRIGTVGNENVGNVLKILGWLSFASLMWSTLLGFLTYLYS